MLKILLTPRLAPDVLRVAEERLPADFAVVVAEAGEDAFLTQAEQADFLLGFVGKLFATCYQRAGRL